MIGHRCVTHLYDILMWIHGWRAFAGAEDRRREHRRRKHRRERTSHEPHQSPHAMSVTIAVAPLRPTVTSMPGDGKGRGSHHE